MERDPAEARPTPADQLEAVRREFDAQSRRFEEARARLQKTVEQIEGSRPRQEILRNSAFARLQARLESMPVIEQAKGIVMAQQRCGPDEAFDLLRRLSQRANVKVSVLAAQIVEHVTSDTTGNVTSDTTGNVTSDTTENIAVPPPAAYGRLRRPRPPGARQRPPSARGR